MEANRTWQLVSTAGNHFVQICQSETLRAEAIARYIQEGVLNGEGVIIIADMALRKNVISNMEMLGLDAQTLKNRGQLRFFDAKFLLFSFVIDGELKEQAFQEVIGDPIHSLQLKYGKVRVVGEMMNILLKQGQYDAAKLLVEVGKNLAERQEYSHLCIYSLDDLQPHAYEEVLERICKFHSHLTPVEDLVSSGTLVGEVLLDAFESAWSRVVNKLAESQKNSTKMTPRRVPLLS
ncbi:MEDS domain-containing protein [Nitrosomonas sp. Nm166]|uniref:MEDS domain-containing protein n=1 Tax=Nitrosomonas sp. Nm166 TaxID=1881054 RepID=UPI0008F073E8|nr:MEDS domain-containing protein [Nitrosomonas sp. Nm166]SFE11791.1 MEDS: MEthanogen/methylotroph, DcmR Sensory domain [Nitrosomonas sp. Nm166]